MHVLSMQITVDPTVGKDPEEGILNMNSSANAMRRVRKKI